MKIINNENIKTETEFFKNAGGYLITITHKEKAVSFLGYETKTRGSWKKNIAAHNALYSLKYLNQYLNLFKQNATKEDFIQKFKENMEIEFKII